MVVSMLSGSLKASRVSHLHYSMKCRLSMSIKYLLNENTPQRSTHPFKVAPGLTQHEYIKLRGK